MLKTAIILAGGFGTRLQSVVSDVPKPMALVNEKPFLQYLLDYLLHFEFEEVVLSTGYLAQTVSEHFGSRYKGLEIKYAVETNPLGTGGAIKNSFDFTDAKEALVLNGDSFFDVDLRQAASSFERSMADGLIVLREMKNPDRFGTVKLNPENRITRFEEKKIGLEVGLINTGIYILKRTSLADFKVGSNFSIEEDFFKPMVSKTTIVGWKSKGYFIDIGIPEEYDRAQSDFKTFKYST